MIKNITELAMEVARRERGKKQVNIAQIKEILAIISDLTYEHKTWFSWSNPLIMIFQKNGQRRKKLNRNRHLRSTN